MKFRARFLLVPPMYVVVVAIFYGLCDLLLLWLENRLRQAGSDPGLLQLRANLGNGLVLATLLYGAQRVYRFHPRHNSSYRQWLEQSPWTCRLPLPLGPVSFAWQDALLIGVTTLVGATRWEVHPMVPFCAFAAGFAFTSCVAMMHSESPLILITAILVGLPAMILCTDQPALALFVAIVVLSIAHVGLWQSLARFPWPRKDPEPDLLIVGPPFNRLGPVLWKSRIPRGLGLHIGLLGGWWLFAIALSMDGLERADIHGLLGALSYVGIFAGLGRCAVYCSYYHSPLSLLGRLATGRLIIPRYDYVFVPPIAAALAAVSVPWLCVRIGAPPDLALWLSITITTALITELGPSLADWRLTGAHSMFPFKGPPAKLLSSGSATDRQLARLMQ
jgi:hypothetical protein